MIPKIYVVVPCYNETEVLADTAKKLKEHLSGLMEKSLIARDSRVMFVDDGSRDGTWALIEKLHADDPLFHGLKLAHNEGHQKALWAGMMTVKDSCDALISIDADLQDDIGAMYGFLEEYANGCDIVYGVRTDRTSDTAFKRVTAQGFYRVMDLMGAETVYNHADYRLMSSRAVNALAEYGEVNLFLRGMVPTLGFKTAQIGYTRFERTAGTSKYPLKRMLELAVEGITSFSVKPIRLLPLLGVLLLVIALGLGIAAIAAAKTWLAVMFAVFLTGGLNLIAVGIVGEYIGKTYLETKHRPKYIAEKILKD